jgi:hypothetical protein
MVDIRWGEEGRVGGWEEWGREEWEWEGWKDVYGTFEWMLLWSQKLHALIKIKKKSHMCHCH